MCGIWYKWDTCLLMYQFTMCDIECTNVTCVTWYTSVTWCTSVHLRSPNHHDVSSEYSQDATVTALRMSTLERTNWYILSIIY